MKPIDRKLKRIAAGLKIEDAAKRIGCSASVIANLESDKWVAKYEKFLRGLSKKK